MRTFLALLLALGIFVGVIFAGGKALGIWEQVSDAPAAAEPPSASTVPLPDARAEKQRPAKKRAAQNRTDPHAPRERLNPADTALAKRAVLRSSDMRRGTRKAVRPYAGGGPGCPANDSDLSRFTIRGKASSAFGGGDSRIESRVKLFANSSQAALFFEATENRTVLRCIRDGVKRALAKRGLRPGVLYARLKKEPPVGTQTAIYLIDYAITLSDGARYEYPVDLISFQVGRAVGAVSFSFVPSDDGL